MKIQKSRFEGLFETPGNEPAQPISEPDNKTVRGEESLEERNQEKKKSRKQKDPFSRIKTNYELRQDYVKEFKRIAVDEERKIYEVIDEAMGEYLERRRESKNNLNSTKNGLS